MVDSLLFAPFLFLHPLVWCGVLMHRIYIPQNPVYVQIPQELSDIFCLILVLYMPWNLTWHDSVCFKPFPD
jgi:hypothetical protein